jgi:DNA-binding CsgD family transcriptional regulator/tetratricopeptide (TPR) repeat protein
MVTTARQRKGALIGRAQELAEFDRALERLAGGQPGVIQVVGEPGIGKSRLLAELAHRAEATGYLVLDGRAAEFEQDVPFALIIDALNDYLATLEPAFLRAVDDAAVQELAEVFPALSRFVAQPPGQRSAPERYRFHYAVRAVLERLAARRPVLLALDDIHWADPESFDVMSHLLRRFRGPLLMTLAFRQTPTRLAGALEGATRAGFSTRLDIAPLSSSEAQALVDGELDAGTWATLYRESGGNPFYLEQLARSHSRALPRAAAAPAEPESWAPPAAVLAAIIDELDHLNRDCRTVLDAAAVVGESFEPELVAAIVERQLTPTLAALDELLDVDLIRPTTTPQRFRFRHPIVRRAVYEGMPRAWRLGAHARAAAALERMQAPAGARAHHIERSAIVGDEGAVTLLVDAARAAAPRAPLTAGRWLLAALRLLAPDAEIEQRLGLLVEAGTAMMSGGAYAESLAALEEALALVPPSQLRRRADVIARLAYAKRRSGRPFDSRVVLQNALDSLPPGDDPPALSLRMELALDQFWHDEFDAMGDLAGHLLVAARERGDQPMISLSAALTSLAASSERRLEEAVASLTEAQAAFGALADYELAEWIYVSFYVGLAALRLERAEDALTHVGRGLDVARMTGQAMTVSPWLAIASRATLMKGELSEALRLADGAIDAALLSADDWRTVWALEADAMAAFWAGDGDRALASAREMLVRSEHLHPFLTGPAQIQLAGALYVTGDPASALARLQRLDSEPGRRLLDMNAAHGWELLVRTQLALGDTDLAAVTAARASRRADATRLPQQMATVRCAQAAVMLARGDPPGARQAALDGLRLADSGGNPVLGARARALAGLALVADGELAQGIMELERSEQTLSRCGAVRDADAAARDLRRLGRRVPRRVRRHDNRTGLTALSPREREVVEHVAQGRTNREIAAALFLSEKTVGTHLARIFEKVGVRSRAALAAIIAREGLD